MSSEAQVEVPGKDRRRRVIKRYSNRKLYDTRDSRYVTLAQIADLVRAGEDVQIIDNSTKEDKTQATLALILSEAVKTQPKTVPLNTLRELIHSRSERILTTLREGPIGRLIPSQDEEEATGEAMAEAVKAANGDPVKAQEAAAKVLEERLKDKTQTDDEGGTKGKIQEIMDSSRQTFDQWQAAVDERLRFLLPAFVRDVLREVKKLNRQVVELKARVEELEAQIKAQSADKSD